MDSTAWFEATVYVPLLLPLMWDAIHDLIQRRRVRAVAIRCHFHMNLKH
jgi:hypothetical protein